MKLPGHPGPVVIRNLFDLDRLDRLLAGHLPLLCKFAQLPSHCQPVLRALN